MLKPFDQGLGAIADVIEVAISQVSGEHGDDLVVGLLTVDHSKATDRFRG
jgi:hypothetical protein